MASTQVSGYDQAIVPTKNRPSLSVTTPPWGIVDVLTLAPLIGDKPSNSGETTTGNFLWGYSKTRPRTPERIAAAHDYADHDYPHTTMHLLTSKSCSSRSAGSDRGRRFAATGRS